MHTTDVVAIVRSGDLEIAQDMTFQRRSWAVQRVGWGVVAVTIGAALLGLLGSGPLSRSTAVAPGAFAVEYERFVRELVAAERAPIHAFEAGGKRDAEGGADEGAFVEKIKYFAGCTPIEAIAEGGERSLAFGNFNFFQSGGTMCGGAYHPVLKRVDEFLKTSLRRAMEVRHKRAKTVLDLDDLVVKQVEALKARGMTSPYLKSFVVARVNPIRFRPKDAPPLSFDEALNRMMQAAQKFNPDKVKLNDLAKSGGALDEAE